MKNPAIREDQSGAAQVAWVNRLLAIEQQQQVARKLIEHQSNRAERRAKRAKK